MAVSSKWTTYRVDSRVWIDLESVDIVSRVLEQAIVRVEHLMGQQVEPFSVDQ